MKHESADATCKPIVCYDSTQQLSDIRHQVLPLDLESESCAVNTLSVIFFLFFFLTAGQWSLWHPDSCERFLSLIVHMESMMDANETEIWYVWITNLFTGPRPFDFLDSLLWVLEDTCEWYHGFPSDLASKCMPKIRNPKEKKSIGMKVLKSFWWWDFLFHAIEQTICISMLHSSSETQKSLKISWRGEAWRRCYEW